MSTTRQARSAPRSPTRLGQPLQDPLRDLQPEVRRQVPEQLPVAGHAVRVLPGRRLLRHHRPARHRRSWSPSCAPTSDLPSPIKELIDWDQQRQDVQIKYEQVIDQFQPEGMMAPDAAGGPDGRRRCSATNSWPRTSRVAEDPMGQAARQRRLTLPTAAHVAVIGGSGSGEDVLGEVLARHVPTSAARSGSTARTLPRCPSTSPGRATAYVGQETYPVPGSVRDNLLFGLSSGRSRGQDDDDKRAVARVLAEARAGRQSAFDPNADWIDYELAGASGPARSRPHRAAC